MTTRPNGATSTWTAILTPLTRKQALWLLGLVAVIGIGARVLLATAGHNFDFKSYMIVSDLRLDGKNVYASTNRYNYGPAWFLVLEGFRYVANLTASWQRAFRLEIVLLLTAADMGLAVLVAARYGLTRGIAFFLNPISIFISGYHGQFDNIAIVLALAGALLWTSDENKPELSHKQLGGAILIGVSLVFKHIMFLLPVWLAIRAVRRRDRFVVVAVPYFIFGASFLPFLTGGGLRGIIDNVLFYGSAENSPLWTPLGLIGLATPLFVAALFAGGLLTRRLDIFDVIGIYLLILVVTSPAVVNQYLAIPMLLIVARSNLFTYAYVGVSTLLLLGHSDGLGILWFDNLFPYTLQWPDNQRWYIYSLPVLLLAVAGAIAWRNAAGESRLQRAPSG